MASKTTASLALVVLLTGLASAPGRVAGQDQSPRLRAAMESAGTILVEWVAADRADVPNLRLTDGRGRRIGIEAVLPNTGSVSLVVPAVDLDPRRVYFVEDIDLDLRARARRDSWFRSLYSSKPLGANVSDDLSHTWFRIFAPRADMVKLHIYFEAQDSTAATMVDLERDADGVWETRQEGNHHGLYYDYTIHGPDDPGNFFYDTHPVHVSDPYARVSVDSFGKSRVWLDTPPPPTVSGGRPPMESVVAYEVHVQDFTDFLPVERDLRGTLPAMAQTGLSNAAGQPVGFDYLMDLGVNVVHLMPVQEFLHYPDREWRADMANDPFAREMGIDRENYQWGYRTTHAFAVESRFRSRTADWGEEREEFKALVEAFHRRGISVIIDVVPNHTGENMDGRHFLFNFNAIDLPYYHRTDTEVRHIGPFGNEIKTEERPMVQRWLIDQLRHWTDELGVDGFRIDLAGQVDEQTLLEVKRQLPADLIIYGEPWIAPSDPDVRANADWSWYKADAPITFFQDDARDAFKGSVFSLADRGFAGGDYTARSRVMAALSNNYSEEPTPNAGLNYLDIHDNWALADRYALRDNNGLQGVDEAAVRLAAGLLFTSVGPVVIHGGTEMLRSKGLAPVEEFERHIAGGTIYFKGRGDTYNLRAPNRFLWESLGEAEVLDMRDHWKGLIALRMSPHGVVFRTDSPAPDHYQWFPPENEALLGYVVGGQVAVAVNVGDAADGLTMDLPEGTWRLVSNGLRVDHVNGVSGTYPRLTGGPQSLEVPAGSMLIWVRD